MLNIYQIYYQGIDPTTLDYTPYLNEVCTPYFENSVIRTLVEQGKHREGQYFGVVSHKLRQKTGGSVFARIGTTKGVPFSPEAFEAYVMKHRPDICCFNTNGAHNPVALANRFHPNFEVIMRKILTKIKYSVNLRHIPKPIYFNHFVATPHIWDKYTSELLFPAMDIMESDDEIRQLVWKNSNYPNPLPQHLAQAWGVNYYPYHTFICERLINVFLMRESAVRVVTW